MTEYTVSGHYTHPVEADSPEEAISWAEDHSGWEWEAIEVGTARRQPTIEILHTRDPDSDCGVRVWIDGVEVKTFAEYRDLDPGRGYDDETWKDNVESAREADTSPAFKEAVLAAYTDMKPTQEKWSV